jgi:cysteinyl-tRNA synthetase
MNVTDVGHLSGDDDSGDDKMLKSAEERGKSVLEVADFYTKAFFYDTTRLNVLRPDVVCKATEHIADMIALIKKIEANGFTYQAGGNLYFDIAKFPVYGELAGLRLDDLKAGARTEIDGNKRNAGDFVLWFTKSKFENQALMWDSPWGRGYPGWHIECSAMSMKYLGEQFDIHAGGIDHIQIHHTNEIAQSEAASGKHPWVRFWVHNEFLVLDKGKMSKSTGGFITLQNLVDQGFDPLDLRYFMLGGHYRNQLQFSLDSLQSAQNSRKSLQNSLRALAEKAGWRLFDLETIKKNEQRLADGKTAGPPSCGQRAAEHLAAFNAALDDDLNTPRALSALWGLVKDNGIPADEAIAGIIAMDDVLGLSLIANLEKKADTNIDDGLKSEIETLIADRAAAKSAKDFAKADAIRNGLKDRGIILEDSTAGTTWRKI